MRNWEIEGLAMAYGIWHIVSDIDITIIQNCSSFVDSRERPIINNKSVNYMVLLFLSVQN